MLAASDAHVVPPTRHYLSALENVSEFEELRRQVWQALVPQDIIEQIWVEELCSLEWEGVRLRSAKKAALDNAFAVILERRLRALPSENTRAAAMSPDWIAGAVRGYVRGVPADVEHVQSMLGHELARDVTAEAYLDELGVMAGLERLLHSCNQRRDTVLSRIYGRRELLAS